MDICKHTRVDRILATATSAILDAAIDPAFKKQIEKDLGVSIHVLDGKEDAYYDALGAFNNKINLDSFSPPISPPN